MYFKKLLGAAAAVLLTAALTSCNAGKAPAPTIDANAIYTAAAQTLAAADSARETQTAQAVTSTPAGSPTSAASPTPLATFAIATGAVPFATSGGTTFSLPTLAIGSTPLPSGGGGGANNGAVGCNNAVYIGETGPADKTEVTAGKPLEKGWSMDNTGTCPWGAGYSFAFLSGEQLGGKDVVITSKDTATAPGHSQSFIVKLTAPTTPGEYIGNWQMKAPDGTRFGNIVFFDVVVK